MTTSGLPQVPVTRTLAALLRRELASLRRSQASLFVAQIEAVPDDNRLEISYGGQTAIIPRLSSYTAPVVGGGCYCLACGPLIIALGRTPP